MAKKLSVAMKKQVRRNDYDREFTLFVVEWIKKYKITEFELLNIFHEHMGYSLSHLRRINK